MSKKKKKNQAGSGRGIGRKKNQKIGKEKPGKMHVSVITLVFNIILLPVVLGEFGNFSHIHKLRVLPEAHSKILEV